jgi:hypothetical protein
VLVKDALEDNPEIKAEIEKEIREHKWFCIEGVK